MHGVESRTKKIAPAGDIQLKSNNVTYTHTLTARLTRQNVHPHFPNINEIIGQMGEKNSCLPSSNKRISTHLTQ